MVTGNSVRPRFEAMGVRSLPNISSVDGVGWKSSTCDICFGVRTRLRMGSVVNLETDVWMYSVTMYFDNNSGCVVAVRSP
jgi:hypothetical protein